MNEYLKLLQFVKVSVVTFKSNYARNNAGLIAEAASRYHITCLNANGRNCGHWVLTNSGSNFLYENGGCQ
ncbi:hypothetical protein [Pasteurella phage vB_PmuP_PHB02]|uniref:HNS binding protein n=1 Tax=Pasteurella phage vB_PmuP_PHB02 TaxID=2005054 RepID=A0A1Y0T1Z8_9CAUD|nr:hypothetical protein HOR82_gp24 [Pasteurella phage vB_PmuP_PHB02]ARV77588.1 hypothetical protein [Pasteurella phage vB_PmuP_PHB02]